MQLLVTGASGFIGQAFARLWCEPAIAVSRHRPQFLGNWTWIEREIAIKRKIGEVAIVLHLEVKQHVLHPTPRDEVEFERVNVGGTTAWLRWCEENNVFRFAYFSSINAVQADKFRATDETAIGPNATPYGASKWRAEQRVRAWVDADSRRSALIVRPAVVYGAGNMANIDAMVQAIRRGRFFLVGQSRNIKTIVSVKNVVSATRHLLGDMKEGKCEVYNFADAKSYSIRELDRMVRARFGKKGNSPTIPLLVGRLAAGFGDALYAATGKSFPINSSRLRALTESTHFSCEKLLATGFAHPQTTDAGLAELLG